MGEHRWRAALRAVLGPILGIGLGLGCGSRDRAAAVDRAACERLRAHLVELRLGGVTADREAHRANLLAGFDSSFVESCASGPPEAFECQMNARNLAELAQCAEAP